MDSESTPPNKPSAVPVPKLKPKRKRRPPAVPWKKPKDMPRRPLSAYNLFFRQEREKMLAKKKGAVEGGEDADASDKSKTGGFANLARTVGAKWKTLPADEKAPFEKEAAREKARYDSQMLGWRAAQEQKKAQKAGGSQHIIDSLTSGAALQSYAAQLGAAQAQLEATQKVEYPDDWFQAADPPRTANVDAALNALGLKEQQQRALFMQQQQQLQQSVSGHPMGVMGGTGCTFSPSASQPSGQIHMNVESLPPQQQQQAVQHAALRMEEDKVDKKLPATLSELSPMRHRPTPMDQRGAYLRAQMTRPTLMGQRGASLEGVPIGYQSQFRHLGDESSITAGLLQQSFFGASSDFQNLQRPPSFGEETPRVARVAHRSSIGVPPGYQPPMRQVEQAQRMVRSQSFPSSLSLSPKAPSPEENSGRLPLSLEKRGLAGLETPLSPVMQSPRRPLSPQTTAQRIMQTPNMIPTPPQQHDSLMNSNSPREGMELSRPLSAPPPNFPGDDEFQSIDTPRYISRKTTTVTDPRPSPQQAAAAAAAEAGGTRLSEEMDVESSMNDLSASNQGQRNDNNLFQSTYEALDSEDAVDFLSNLKFVKD